MRWSKLFKRAALVGIAIVFCAVVFLAVTGVPAPPAITATGAPRIPWEPIAEGISMVSVLTGGEIFLDWHPSGEGVIARTSGLRSGALHHVTDGGKGREELLKLSTNIGAVKFNPDPDKHYLIYLKDVGGNEYDQVYFHDLEAKETRRLTDGVTRHSFPQFDEKGERLAFLGRAPDSAETAFYVVDPTDQASPAVVSRQQGDWWLGPWSPDGQSLLAYRVTPPNRGFLCSVDVASGEVRTLGSGEEGEVSHESAVWSRDGKYVYYTSDWESEFQSLRRIDLTTSEDTALTPNARSDSYISDLSSDGAFVGLLVNREGARRPYLFDTRTSELRELAEEDGAVLNLRFHPTDPKVAWSHIGNYVTRSVGGRDLAVGAPLDLGERDDPPELDEPAPRVIRYPTFDTVDGEPRMISAWYWEAHSEDSKPTPVLITIHGGPAAQSGPINPLRRVLGPRGISEIHPNVRGSTGYGKTFESLDDRRLRMDSVKDIGALLDWIETQPNLDSSRVVVYGASYGGFMTLASAVEFSDRIVCGADFFGVSDLENLNQETREGMREWARAEFGDERDPETREFFASISPLQHLERIKIPLFIFQGANDTRVPVGESRRAVEALRAGDQPVWYFEAADQGHQMPNPVNMLYIMPAAMTFIDECMERGG